VKSLVLGIGQVIKSKLYLMSSNNILVLVLGLIFAAVLVFFLVRRNQKDKEELNPDSESAVEQRRMDDERERDKI
jgi:LPXTG-motif cell wall-anchored protein